MVEDGKPVAASERVGFFVTRFVEADSVDQAEENALSLLRSEPKLAQPPGYEPIGEARVFFEEISEVALEDVPDPQSGFVFFDMESDVTQ